MGENDIGDSLGGEMKYLGYLASTCLIFWGCEIYDDSACGYENDTGNFKYNIPFGSYRGESEFFFWEGREDVLIEDWEWVALRRELTLELNSDSSFSFVSVWHHLAEDSSEVKSDTLEWTSGKYSVQNVPLKPWHSFILSADSFFRREILVENGKVAVLDSVSAFFSPVQNSDTVLLDQSDSCFTLAVLDNPDDDFAAFCPDPEIRRSRKFCMNSRFRDSVTVGIVSNTRKW